MEKMLVFGAVLTFVFAFTAMAQDAYEEDSFKTNAGNLKITFIGHGSLMLTFGKTIVHIDPVMREGDYTKLPKADVILVTHEHGDHLDSKAIGLVTGDTTQLVYTELCAAKHAGGTVMKNGDVKTVSGLKIEAVPAYNILHKRDTGAPFHPKGNGNGYVVTVGDKRLYIAGDTENIPEMKAIKNIDIAFLPMNLPYTMTPEMTADAARTIKPKILYPYHFGGTDTSKLTDLLKNEKDIEVRIRKME